MRFIFLFSAIFWCLSIVAQPLVSRDEKNITISLKKGKVLELPLENFLEAREGEGKVKFKMAAFDFKDKTKRVCDKIKVNSIQEGKGVYTIAGQLSGENCDCEFNIELTPRDENGTYFSVEVSDPSLNRLTFRFRSHEEEHFFGFGEQFSHLNFKGHKFPVFCEEQGLGRGDKGITRLAKMGGAAGNEYTTYAPIPFFLTTDKRAMFLENTEYIEYDLSQAKMAEVNVWSNEINGWLWLNEPLLILEDYTAVSGRMPAMPDWAYGTWLGLQGGAERVRKIVKETKEAGNPVSAIWIQDWVGKRKTRIGSRLWWKWVPDTVNYPNFKGFCEEMNREGVKVLGYINSFLADEGPMFEEAKSKGYLVKDQKGKDYELAAGGFKAYLVDLTNPEAFEWLKGIIKTNLIGNGLSGWMADFAEWLPPDAKLYSGVDPMTYHNQYPVDWARLNREAIKEAGKERDIFFFSRSGFGNSNKYSTLFWAGDQMVTWGEHDGFPSAIKGLLSSGMSGLGINHTDIGGYTTVSFMSWKYTRSRDLFYRWAEMAAFTPVYRTHEGLIPEKNFQFYNDSAGQEHFAKMGKLHFALKEYIRGVTELCEKRGYPVVMHPFLLYPNDKTTWDLKYQYFLGGDLLVLPVIEEGATEVEGYFPRGKWENIWTGEVLEGLQFHTVEAPLGQPAVFIQVNGIWSNRIRMLLQDVK